MSNLCPIPRPMAAWRAVPDDDDDHIPLSEEIDAFPVGLSLPLTRPEPSLQAAEWTLVAHNRRILAAWNLLCRETPANARNCYDWLSRHATRTKPRRCYPLKGKENAGCWGYEIGAGDRVYYKPDEPNKKATIYFAGPHPPKIPGPPQGI